MTTRVALVVGWRGQDGHYLTELLRARGDHVIGLGRDAAWSSREGDLPGCDVRDRARVAALLAERRPDEIYYLAGVFDSAEAAARDPVDDFRRGHEVHVTGWHHFLDAVERQKLPALVATAAPGLPVVGDASRLLAATGWRPQLGFEATVRKMAEAELRAGRGA